MTLIEGLYAFLGASPGVTALTGPNLFPAEGQAGSMPPRVVYHRSRELDDNTLDRGNTKSPTATIVLDCYGGRWGGGYKSSRTLADAVLSADGGLGGKKLMSYAGPWGTVAIQSCRNTDDADQDSPALDSSGRNEQSVQLTFEVAYIE